MARLWEGEKLMIHERWIKAMSAAADILQNSGQSESRVLETFQEVVSGMGLRGGVAFLDPSGASLRFARIVQPGKTNIFRRFEKLLDLQRTDFTVPLEKVDVYLKVIQEKEAVFVPESSAILSQMLSFAEEGVLSKMVEAFGKDPAIYTPLINLDTVVGMMNVAGSNLTEDDLPAMKAFSSYLSAALSNAHLIQQLKDNEEKYRSLFDNLPIGIYRVTADGRFIMANPVFLHQFRIPNFSAIQGRTMGDLGLIPRHDRGRVLKQLVANGQIFGLETEWETPNGRHVVYKENIKAAYDEDGSLLYYEGSVEDISDQKQVDAQLEKQVGELLILNRIAAVGVAAQSVDELLNQVTDLIGDLLFPEHFGVLIWNHHLRCFTVHTSYRGVTKEDRTLKIPPDQGVVGVVYQSGQPLRLSDVSQFPGYIPPPGPKFHSELCVPIRSGEKVLAVLNAESTQRDAFSLEDEQLLQTIADLLATAFDRLTFFDAVEDQALQLTLLNEAVLTTSRVLDPAELIDQIGAQIKVLFKPDSFMITLFDQTSDMLEVAYSTAETPSDGLPTGTKLPLSQGGLTALVVDTGKVLKIEDLEKSPLLVGDEQTDFQMVGSWVGVPLISGKRVIGVLAVQYLDPTVIDDRQVQFLVSMASHAAIAIANGRLFDDIQRRFELNARLARIGETLNRPQKYQEVIELVGRSAMDLLAADQCVVLALGEDQKLSSEWSHGFELDCIEFLEQNVMTWLQDNSRPWTIPDIDQNGHGAGWGDLCREHDVRAVSLWPLVYEAQTNAVVACFKPHVYYWDEEEKDVMMTFCRQAAVSIQNALLLELERTRRFEAEALYKTTTVLTSSLEIDRVLDNILVELYRVVDYSSARIQLLEDGIVRVVAAQGLALDAEKVVGWSYPASNALFAQMMETHQPIVLENAHQDDRYLMIPALSYVRGWIGVPLVVGDRMIGCLAIDSDRAGAFNHAHAEKARAFANQAAIAIESARLFSQTQRRLQVLQSIHTIDQTISRSMDLTITLDVFIEQALNLLGVDILRLFEYETDSQMFDLLQARDLTSPTPFDRNDFFDPSIVEQAIVTREVQCCFEVNPRSGFGRLDFGCYAVAPMITRGELRGVIEAFTPKDFQPKEEWIDLLKTLSTQAAIALENNALVTSLRRSNEELVTAYDRTLEGWAYALELRDRETIGHSRRVTELTLRLARRMGISGLDLVNIRRGTLLHDIGKMGLPDSVLLKKGPLTIEETAIMQTHPQLAYDMLVSIPYLKTALEIPYAHHERWDGTGYPNRLKGEEIPLSARIFAVVDVWDALVSDRPYRNAWEKKIALNYLRQESGRLFDPKVVDVFFELVDELPESFGLQERNNK
jgi:PAS domain S-box-containing protein